jgi:hypothetical protein
MARVDYDLEGAGHKSEPLDGKRSLRAFSNVLIES